MSDINVGWASFDPGPGGVEVTYPCLLRYLRDKTRVKERLQAALDRIVDQLRHMGAVKIVLFGSLAKGEVDVYSDIDLLVIMPSQKSGKVWWRIINENVERGIATDIIVFNQTEFEHELPINALLKEIVDRGKIVYEKAAKR